jgi:hypothetical protein
MGTSAVIPATLLASAVGLLFVTTGRPVKTAPDSEEAV